MGNFSDPPGWPEVINHFRGSELQNYFQKLTADELKTAIKPQHVDAIPKAAKGTVAQILEARDFTNQRERYA